MKIAIKIAIKMVNMLVRLFDPNYKKKNQLIFLLLENKGCIGFLSVLVFFHEKLWTY